MRRCGPLRASAAACLLLALLACGAPARAAEESASCAECGMTTAIAAPFTARIDLGRETKYFCDIGDLVAFLARTKPADFAAAVRDYPTGAWVDARKARYVRDAARYRTPMGWGIAAFADPAAAAAAGKPLDLAALRASLAEP